MYVDAVGNGSTGREVRTGARILTLLAAPSNRFILHKLSQGPRRLVDLRREASSVPPTTLRGHLRQLSEIGAIAKRRLHPFPSVREYVLTGPAGRELRFVATTLESWLANAPDGPLSPDDEIARAAVKALVEGWSSTMLRALAPGPLTLTELDRLIGSISYPALDRRLAAMRLAGQVEARPSQGKGTPYAVTEWLRRGVAPLTAAVRWERHHLPDETAPIAPLDAEAGFLLVMPLLKLPAELTGSCRMGVEFGDGGERRLVGVTVGIDQGRVVSCTTRLESNPGSWATGPVAAWLRNAIEADPHRLELGGDRRLARALLDGVNRALFHPGRSAEPSPVE